MPARYPKFFQNIYIFGFFCRQKINREVCKLLTEQTQHDWAFILSVWCNNDKRSVQRWRSFTIMVHV